MFRSHVVRQVTFVLATAFAAHLSFLCSSANAEEAGRKSPSATSLVTAKAGGLTSEEVARRATRTSLAIEEKKHDIEAAQAQVDKSFYDFLPRLSLSGSYYRLSPITNPSLGNLVLAPGAAEGPLPPGAQLAAAPLSIRALENATTATATLTVPFTDYVFRLVQARDAANAQLVASEQSRKATERKTAYDAKALYYDWVRAELEAAVSQQNVDLSREHYARIKALAAADSASEADVARVEATLASSELVLVQTKNLAALQRERITIAMHEEGHRAFEIGEDLRQAPPPGDAIDDIDTLVGVAQTRRPELGALATQRLALEKQAQVARAQALPRLDGVAQGTVANPNQRHFPQTQDFNATWQVGVQLTYTPNDTATGLSQQRANEAKALAVDAQRRSLLDAVRTEVVDAVLSHRNAVASIESSARRLTAAETSYRARWDRFNADKATTVELTEAQTELFSARLDAAKAQVAIRLARARLAYVTGGQ